MNKELLKIVMTPLTWLNRLLPKNEKQIYLYANLGFRDNVKAMYDYMLEQHLDEEYKIVCGIPHPKEYKSSHPEAKNVTFVSPARGILSFMRSKYMFYCFGKYPIYPSKNQTVVNLWHGMPLKTIGNLVPGCENIQYNYFTHLLATSAFFGDIMKRSFKAMDEQIFLSPQPRTDMLFREDAAVLKKIRGDYDKLIVWLPTFRSEDGLGMTEEEKQCPVPMLQQKDLAALNEELAASNACLFIKLHPLQYHEELASYSHIKLLSEEDMVNDNINLYELLRYADGLITDYSSIFFDYLLLDRPIGFLIEDMNQYGQDRGFILKDPLELMPGMPLGNVSDFETFIQHTIEGIDEYKEKRREINEKVNPALEDARFGHAAADIFHRFVR